MLSVSGEVTGSGTDFMIVTAPANAAIHVGFYDERNCYFDGAVVPAGQTRVVAVHGSYFRTTIVPEEPVAEVQLLTV